MKMTRDTKPTGPLGSVRSVAKRERGEGILDPKDPSPGGVVSKDTTENRSQDTGESNNHADQRSYVLGQMRGA
jgi:hypothetical protein